MSNKKLGVKRPMGKTGVEKHVTVLLSDIRGFTNIVESYPADVVFKMLNRYFDCMGKVISRYDGFIDKLMGDSILVVFGLPEEQPTDAERAIACATEMQLAMTEFNAENQRQGLPDLYMGIAVNSGLAIAGQLGSEHYSEYTIIGDVMNLVSRIEAHCLRGQVLISESTFHLTQHHITVGARKSIEVKGGHESLNILDLHATARPRDLQVPRRERRKSPRVLVKKRIAVQSLQGKIVLPEKFEADLVDFSYEGLCFDTEEQLSESCEVKVSIQLEPTTDAVTEAYARVVNTKEHARKHRYGLEITSLNGEAEKAIKLYVDELARTG